jgi:hypothetical protein
VVSGGRFQVGRVGGEDVVAEGMMLVLEANL